MHQDKMKDFISLTNFINSLDKNNKKNSININQNQNLSEHTIDNNSNNYILNNNIPTTMLPNETEKSQLFLIQKLISEKEEIMSQLKEEIIKNECYQKQMKILEEALHSNLVKYGLLNNIGILSEKYYVKSNQDIIPNKMCDYAEILIDISQMKEKNLKLIEENEKYLNIISGLKIELEKFQNMEEEYKKLLCDFKESQILKNDNIILSEANQNLRTEISELMNENLILKNNNINENKNKENEIIKLNNNLNDYNQLSEEIDCLNCKLQNLNNGYMKLLEDKNTNDNYLNSKIQSLQQEKAALEKLLSKNQNFTINIKNQNENVLTDEKLFNENKFLSEIINNIIKYHIQDICVKNMIYELLSLKRKHFSLSENIRINEDNMLSNFTYEKNSLDCINKTKAQNTILQQFNELHDINIKIIDLEKKLYQVPIN